jgi:hypothetical protein
MKYILHNLKHFMITLVILLIGGVGFAVSIGADVHYNDNRLMYKVDQAGPFVFYNDNQLTINYLKGNRIDGYSVDKQDVPLAKTTPLKVYFPLENNHFEFELSSTIEEPKVHYNDQGAILAISDIESGYKAFRDFLIANSVINQDLQWIFGNGHLVLVGDFTDRGYSTNQVLWFIYKLEQEAKLHDGTVHYILGNHEIKNLQGNFQKAGKKYLQIAAMLGKKEYEMFDENAFLGKWLQSKNSLELINGYLFVHGGIHPDIAKSDWSLTDINLIVRQNYRKAYFPTPEKNKAELLLSTTKGPSWYRGYFNQSLSQVEVASTLEKFGAKAVVVGHTPQGSINTLYQGKVIAIDVNHPKDYRDTFPTRHSEALLIENSQYFRLLEDGTKELL